MGAKERAEGEYCCPFKLTRTVDTAFGSSLSLSGVRSGVVQRICAVAASHVASTVATTDVSKRQRLSSPPPRCRPVIVSGVPPEVGPLDGETELTIGSW